MAGESPQPFYRRQRLVHERQIIQEEQQKEKEKEKEENQHPSCSSLWLSRCRSGHCNSNNNTDDDRKSHKPQKDSGSGHRRGNNSRNTRNSITSINEKNHRIQSINGRNINYENKRCTGTSSSLLHDQQHHSHHHHHHHRHHHHHCPMTIFYNDTVSEAPPWKMHRTFSQQKQPVTFKVRKSLHLLLSFVMLFTAIIMPPLGGAVTGQELGDYDYAYSTGMEMHKRSEQQQNNNNNNNNNNKQQQLEEAPANVTSFPKGGSNFDIVVTTTTTTTITNESGNIAADPSDYAPIFKNLRNMGKIHAKPSGTSVQLPCAAFGKPEPNITWTREGKKIYRHIGRIKKTKWSVNMEDLVPEDSGAYTCTVCNYLGCINHTAHIVITDRVNHKPIPLIQPKNLTLAVNGSGEMECTFLSDLHSQLIWWYTSCNSTYGCSQNRTQLVKDKTVYKFENVDFDDEGWYTCICINGLGQASSAAYLRVVTASMLESSTTTITKIVRSPMWMYIASFVVIPLFVLMAIVLGMYILRRMKHEKLLKQRIETVHQWTKKVIIYKPTSGDSSGSMDTMIMPVVKIEKQRTTVLQSSNSEPAPFNEYEFPLDSNWEIPRNQLILGTTLGEGAFGRVVMAEVNNDIVAVKMVKEGHTDDDIASLVREMEVMKIIGKNINIINLLGCCSQSGPLYVIVEFAPYGNLKDFLNKNHPLNIKDYLEGDRQQQLQQTTTAASYNPQHQLTEKHLISFAFQIARGMAYLASRRCIHRDLAARNVLVSEDYVMKIADFGLARDIQDTDYYRKNTNGRLPIKWMAPESLQDKFYDSQSDVWSYGILLWEIMTFGAQPYPTIMSAEELYSYLMSGQRMEKPPKCSLNIYMLMRQCWHFDATARPTFTEIVENLDKLLLANGDYLDVAVANLETPPSSSDEEDEEVDEMRFHYF